MIETYGVWPIFHSVLWRTSCRQRYLRRCEDDPGKSLNEEWRQIRTVQMMRSDFFISVHIYGTCVCDTTWSLLTRTIQSWFEHLMSGLKFSQRKAAVMLVPKQQGSLKTHGTASLPLIPHRLVAKYRRRTFRVTNVISRARNDWTTRKVIFWLGNNSRTNLTPHVVFFRDVPLPTFT